MRERMWMGPREIGSLVWLMAREKRKEDGY